jgi:hypothetical protein
MIPRVGILARMGILATCRVGGCSQGGGSQSFRFLPKMFLS